MEQITLLIPPNGYTLMYEFLKEVLEKNRSNINANKKEIRKLLKAVLNVIPIMPDSVNGIIITGTKDNISLCLPDKIVETSYFAIDNKLHVDKYENLISAEFI
jgi:hypothetical protein